MVESGLTDCDDPDSENSSLDVQVVRIVSTAVGGIGIGVVGGIGIGVVVGIWARIEIGAGPSIPKPSERVYVLPWCWCWCWGRRHRRRQQQLYSAHPQAGGGADDYVVKPLIKFNNFGAWLGALVCGCPAVQFRNSFVRFNFGPNPDVVDSGQHGSFSMLRPSDHNEISPTPRAVCGGAVDRLTLAVCLWNTEYCRFPSSLIPRLKPVGFNIIASEQAVVKRCWYVDHL